MLRVRAPAERWRCRLTNGGLQGHGVPLQLAGGRDAGRHGPILPSRNRGRGALHFCGSGRRRGAHARCVARPRGPQHRGCAACTKESAHRLCAELGPTRGAHSSPCTSEHKMHPIGWSIVAHKPITGHRDSMFAPTVQSVAWSQSSDAQRNGRPVSVHKSTRAPQHPAACRSAVRNVSWFESDARRRLQSYAC